MSLLSTGFWFPWKIPSLPKLPKAIAKRRIKCFFGTEKVPYAIKQIASRLETGAWIKFKVLYLRKCQSIVETVSKGHSAKLRPINIMGVDFKVKPTTKGFSPLIKSIRTEKPVKKEEKKVLPVIESNQEKSIVHYEQKTRIKRTLSPRSQIEKELAEITRKRKPSSTQTRVSPKELALLEKKAKNVISEGKLEDSSEDEEVPLDEEQKYINFLKRQEGSDSDSDEYYSLMARYNRHRSWLEESPKKGQVKEDPKDPP
jgi:hypothetical protein